MNAGVPQDPALSQLRSTGPSVAVPATIPPLVTLSEAETAQLVLNYLNDNPRYAASAKTFERDSRVVRSILEPPPVPRHSDD